MTPEELIKEIDQLPLDQQVELLESISRSVQAKLRGREDRIAAFNHLRGIAKPDGPLPSDEEIKEDYIRYLEEKYS